MPTKTKRSLKAVPQLLVVPLDQQSNDYVTKAAGLRRSSIDEYVRVVSVAQARREVEESEQSVIALTPSEQLAFWNALNEPVKLTKRQKNLGVVMRGEREKRSE